MIYLKGELTVFVTGVAGFIGSHLAERLVQHYNVIGIDCFTEYYSHKIKESNIAALMKNENFKLIRNDLVRINPKMLDGVELVFHEAAQPGVIASWDQNFKTYVRNNILVTQKLLEVCLDSDIRKFVFASSSSVYGDVTELPVQENALPKPFSPYGVTKLAAENLCYLYWKNYGLPTISLRYFTVYGPRQRPDMAISRFIDAILNNREVRVYGKGNQTRDFTYVSDIVNANILAANNSAKGEVFNIGGGSTISIIDLISILEKIIGKKAKVIFGPTQKGDVRNTWADVKKAATILGYIPQVEIEDGLKKQVEWTLRCSVQT